MCQKLHILTENGFDSYLERAVNSGKESKKDTLKKVSLIPHIKTR